MTNSERRISRTCAAVPPPGEARHDWRILVDFARRLGAALGREGTRLFPYATPEEIFNEHRATTRGRDLDISGLSYALLERRGPQQWPFPEGAKSGKARLYEDGRYTTANGRARFAPAPHRPVAEPTDARYPLHLTTGRLRDHWHGMSRTGNVARLFTHTEEPLLSMHRDDMQRRGLIDSDIVRVRSRRGEIRVRVQGSEEMRAGQTYLPMHWGGRFLSGGGINALTLAAFDPVSRQPELKHAAVQVEKLDYRWQVVALRSGDASGYLDAVRPLLERFAYASCGLYGRNVPLLVFRAAAESPAADTLIAELDRVLELDDDTCAMDYRDARRGIAKRVLVQDGKLVGARLTGETAARDWLKELLAQGASADAVRRWVLAPVTRPPLGHTTRGRVVCNCFDVAETQIRERFAAGQTFDQVQTGLKCGTSCGSCLPELRRIAQLAQAAA